MPYQWIDPKLFVEYAGVAVYHCYTEDNQVSAYWYTPDVADCDLDEWGSHEAPFDVRDLPSLGLDVEDRDTHAAIIRHAIGAGLITGEPAVKPESPPLRVKIEVWGGVAHVVEQSPGVEVAIIDHDIDRQDDRLSGQEADTTQPPTLVQVSERLAFVVTELNGLVSLIVNEDVTKSDVDHPLLTELLARLAQVETAVNELADLFWHHA
jgi:hypothetical protein